MVYILIDFDNFFDYKPADPDFDWLEFELNQLTSRVLKSNSRPEFISFRLYGGWMENGSLTNLASRIQQSLSSFDIFPFYKHSERVSTDGETELVTRLISMPDLQWDNTAITRSGIPRLRVVSGLPPGCAGTNETCPVRILFRFSKKRTKKCPVPGCPVTNQEAFKIVEQKMVDTMLSCDIVTLSEDERVEKIIVASDDFDMLPSMAIAARNYTGKPGQICLLRTNSNYNYDIFNRLIAMGLKVSVKGN
ncbi:MAG TPA: NYN domain-containing protein [Desulfobacterales bacterium]|nr:NYN domain-containing protein [Desulfobacterales bacterium]